MAGQELDILIVKNTAANTPAAFTSSANRASNAVVVPTANVKSEFTNNITSTPIVNKVLLQLDLKRVQKNLTIVGTIVNTGGFADGEAAKIDLESKLENTFLGGKGVTVFWPMRFDSDGTTAFAMPVDPNAPTATEQDRYYFGNVTRVEIEQEAGMGGGRDYAYHVTIVVATNVARQNTLTKGT